MQEAKKKRLREAWHGPLNAGQVARANAVGEAWLRKFWAGEKKAGRLPDGPRPHFLDRIKRDEPAVDVADEIAGLDRDESPIGDFNPAYQRESDALLTALRTHHADTPEAHRAPMAWLRFDAKGMPVPTHAMLMRAAANLDRWVCA